MYYCREAAVCKNGNLAPVGFSFPSLEVTLIELTATDATGVLQQTGTVNSSGAPGFNLSQLKVCLHVVHDIVLFVVFVVP